MRDCVPCCARFNNPQASPQDFQPRMTPSPLSPTIIQNPPLPPFKLIKLGCLIRGHTHPSKALHTYACVRTCASWLDKTYCSYMHTHTHSRALFCVHTHTHTHRTHVLPFFSPNPFPVLSLLINSSHPFSLTLHSPPPQPLTQLWGDTFQHREGWRKREKGNGGQGGGAEGKRCTPLLCCHSGLATEAFDVLQISNFIIENPLPSPSSLLLRLNKLFCPPRMLKLRN